MTAELYTAGLDLMLRMLAKYGVDMPLVRTDPNTGVVSNLSIRAMVVNPQSYIIHPASIDPVDERLVADPQVEPKETDNLTKSNGKFNIMRVERIQPADLLLGYRIELRRA